MPLIEGYSREAISANVSREMHRGRDQDQAVAIALNTARRAFRQRFPRRRLPAYLRSNPGMPNRNPVDVRYTERVWGSSGWEWTAFGYCGDGTSTNGWGPTEAAAKADLRRQCERRRNPSRAHRRRNPTHYDWMDLLIPIGVVYLLIRSGRLPVGG